MPTPYVKYVDLERMLREAAEQEDVARDCWADEEAIIGATGNPESDSDWLHDASHNDHQVPQIRMED